MVDENERKRYSELIDIIGWFFFDLFILGYVEDPATGDSFRLHGGLKWVVYVEVILLLVVAAEAFFWHTLIY